MVFWANWSGPQVPTKMNVRVARDPFPRIRKVHLRQKSIYEMDKQYYVSEFSGSVKACESFRPGDPYQEWRINPTAAKEENHY